MPNTSSDPTLARVSWRRWGPLAFLVAMSVSWSLMYRIDGGGNDATDPLPDWLYLIDALIVLPVICLLCETDRKRGVIKAISCAALASLLGSFLIPESSKQVWHFVEQGRYLLLLIVLVMELSAIATVVLAVRSALAAGTEPDRAVSDPLVRWLGAGTAARLLAFEARVWTYALFANRIRPSMFQGEQHFSYHNKDGAQSNAVGFVMLIALEAPLLHLVLHFSVSPWVANVVTLLSCLGLVYMLAEARSMSRRPVSITGDSLVIRYGLFAPLIIGLDRIARIEQQTGRVRRASDIKRYNFSGDPNLCLYLSPPLAGIRKVYLGLDNPESLIRALNRERSR